MNACQIASNSKPSTIGELKKYLSDLEASWSAEDEMYFGTFDAQQLYVATKCGIAQGYMQYHGEFGLVAFQKE